MHAGKIAEQGTYTDLLANGQAFAKLVEGYGSTEKTEDAEAEEEKKEEEEKKPGRIKTDTSRGKAGAAIMQAEERAVGAISNDVYAQYARAMGSWIWAPLLFLLIALAQAATVSNNIFLGFWSAQSIEGWTEGRECNPSLCPLWMLTPL